jgi:hypothetical protein
MGVFLHNGIYHDERTAVFADTTFTVEDMEQNAAGSRHGLRQSTT